MPYLLSFLIFLPLLGAAMLAFLPQPKDQRGTANARVLALWFSGLHLLLSIILLYQFDTDNGGLYQFIERFEWISTFDIYYFLGVDGLAVLFIPLTSLLTFVSILVSWTSITKNAAHFYACLLVVCGLVTGVFAAMDLVLFYIFWEAMLIPMFLMIGRWGGENRVYATLKFFLYTFAGSILMLAALVYIYVHTGTFSIPALTGANLPAGAGTFIWLALFTAFAVKVPMWPFHTWLPDAHVQAPTAGSVLLAGILLKMGAYGFLRLSLPILPDVSAQMAPYMFTLSVIAIIWAALVAFAQTDIKKMIAYSSVSHMGFVTLGVFAGTVDATTGAVLQMINHGIVSGALFMCVGVLYERLHTRDISKLGGIVTPMPYFAAVWVIFMLSSVALPGTNSFVGEFLILMGSFSVTQWGTTLAVTGVVLGATYMLKLTRGMLYGAITNPAVKKMTDVNMREKFMFFPLLALVFFIGLLPQYTLQYIQPWAENMAKNYHLDPINAITETAFDLEKTLHQQKDTPRAGH